ncbi:hypothetical protein KKG81_10220 [bacterium]|nr:hypothetical protein [bacterium]
MKIANIRLILSNPSDLSRAYKFFMSNKEIRGKWHASGRNVLEKEVPRSKLQDVRLIISNILKSHNIKYVEEGDNR